MKFFENIPRGLVIFLSAIIIVVVLVAGYEFLFVRGSANPNGAGGTNSFSSVFPFGGGAPNGVTGNATTTLLTNETVGEVPLLRKISGAPVAGGWFAKGETATSAPRIRFMDRQTGKITETPADSFVETRISNTTMPGVEELLPVTDSTIIVRLLDEGGRIANDYGTVNATSSQQSLTTVALPAFDRIAVAPDGSSILTATKTSSGGSAIALSKPDGSKPQTLLSSPIGSWVPLSGGGRFFVESAPSATANGYLYEIKSGALQTLVGGAPGFAANVSPSGRYAAITTNGQGGFVFSVLDTKGGTISQSQTRAFALSCAWIPSKEPLLFCAVPSAPPSAAYPDDWLLGNVSFSDEAWIVDPAKNTSYFIGPLSDENGVPLDAERVSVDPGGSYALFMNKSDLSLWSLNIAGGIARAEAH